MISAEDTFASLVPTHDDWLPAALAELRYRIIDKTRKDIQPFFVNRGRHSVASIPLL